MSAWISHVKAHYAKMKKKNPSYKYSQALKDAAKTYKKKAPVKKSKKKVQKK